jgi:hypothetical protein
MVLQVREIAGFDRGSERGVKLGVCKAPFLGWDSSDRWLISAAWLRGIPATKGCQDRRHKGCPYQAVAVGREGACPAEHRLCLSLSLWTSSSHTVSGA